MRALVTGGNGHLGYNLVQALLAGGHRVRATVRSLADAVKTAPLRALGGVELVEAELGQPAGIRAAMEGIDTLFHAAAVYSISEAQREQEILDASLRGVECALRAAADAGVGKVVLTSSVVTLPLTPPGTAPVTEAAWATDLRVPYYRAKTEGERLAWRLAGELRLNLASILPGGIIGPGFRQNTPTLNIVEAVMYGAFRLGVPDMNFTWVDVRDVAAAHLLAAERDARGRFIVVDAQLTMHAFMEAMHDIDPSVKLPLMTMPRFAAPLLPLFDRFNHLVLGTPRVGSPEAVAVSVGGNYWNVSSARARNELGWAPAFPFKRSLAETMDAIRARRLEV